MTSQIFCDPCLSDSKSSVAVRYCHECEEYMCKECAEFHLRYKTFKSHQLTDIASAGFQIRSSQKYCSIHENVALDFFCTKHGNLCCRKCIPEIHKACENVLPLEDASKDVKGSSLFLDTLQEVADITHTLQLLSTNRENNLRNLEKTKLSILKQLNDIKQRILKNVNALEEKLKVDLAAIMQNKEHKIEKERNEIAQIETTMTGSKQELEYLKDRGSNNQLFVALQSHLDKIKNSGDQIQEMISTYKEIGIKFEEHTPDIKTIGSLSETSQPCTVKYKPTKLLQGQVQSEVRRSLTEFKLEGELSLKKSFTACGLTDVVVTSDNTLLLCDFDNSKIYAYKDCKYYDNEATFTSRPYGIALVYGTQEAVVTLPTEKSIQFINITNMTKGEKVPVGFACYGVAASENKIIVGGSNVLHLLTKNGSSMDLSLDGMNYITFLHVDTCKENNRILCRGQDKMKCVDLNGTLIYEEDVSGTSGVDVDHQGNVYLGGFTTHDIHRLSPDGQFLDVVLTAENGLNHPCGMTFNNDYTRLFVINNGYKSVQIYGCK